MLAILFRTQWIKIQGFTTHNLSVFNQWEYQIDLCGFTENKVPCFSAKPWVLITCFMSGTWTDSCYV